MTNRPPYCRIVKRPLFSLTISAGEIDDSVPIVLREYSIQPNTFSSTRASESLRPSRYERWDLRSLRWARSGLTEGLGSLTNIANTCIHQEGRAMSRSRDIPIFKSTDLRSDEGNITRWRQPIDVKRPHERNRASNSVSTEKSKNPREMHDERCLRLIRAQNCCQLRTLTPPKALAQIRIKTRDFALLTEQLSRIRRPRDHDCEARNQAVVLVRCSPITMPTRVADFSRRRGRAIAKMDVCGKVVANSLSHSFR